MNKVIVADESDNYVGLKTYEELRYEDIYRVTALWLEDSSRNECLITQRKWTKHNDPGKWMFAVSGTVEEVETYDSNIVTEIEEEIGLTGLKLEKAEKIFVDDGKHRFFVQYYKADVDKDSVTITIQEDEVEAYKWVKISDFIEDVHKSPNVYVPSITDSLRAVGVMND